MVPFEYDRIKLEIKHDGQWGEGIIYTYRTILWQSRCLVI